ncbi:bifunctional hydroxymethylpyrimidine kinase/phosphomethylpyrimidine kinase [Roseateles sp.]|uniref:bifunctional hydroxymethylpyrimidine kinase/phosphomethylpyrimidine kinase n=1 Tax=Roseateles sp. TaxID=1971397 RepID=UPI00391B3F16
MRLSYPHPSLPTPWAQAPEASLTQLPDWTLDPQPPLIWSLAGTDSGGGAGLSADTRAAAALGVHLCPVVAAVTAQHSCAVQAVYPLPAAQIRAQLQALEADMPPRAIKTGLLASVAAIEALVEVLDRLRGQAEVALVVDPVLGATAGGAAFADEALLQAYREQLLPRCTLLTPNRAEAERLLGVPADSLSIPALARGLQQRGAQAVCITGGDERALAGSGELALDWVQTRLPQAGRPVCGWLALPRLPSLHHHGSGCSFASAAAAALARGFVLPDALVLAKMLSWQAVREGHAAGAGAGPVRATAHFIANAQAMPLMSQDDEEALDCSSLGRWVQVLRDTATPGTDFAPGLYGITEAAAQIQALAASGQFAHLQLRIKTRSDDADLPAALRLALRQAGACRLWINDHWRLALAEGASNLHLGQEDWAALLPQERQQLLAGVAAGELGLGLSSHSLWELARARALAPSYIACGPVWPTRTKDMPWHPQGLAQLGWWCRMAGRPVVAIGGLLSPAQTQATAAQGASASCVVRALAEGPAAWQQHAQAFAQGRLEAGKAGLG